MQNPWLDDAQASDDGSASWGDYASTFFNVGGSQLLSTIPAAVRYVGDKLGNDVLSSAGQYVENKVGDYGADSQAELSPAAQAKLQKTFGDEGFWSSLPLKATAMSPNVIASVASLVFAPEATPEWLSLGLSGGALNAGQTLDQIYSKVDQLPDDELQQRSTYYAGLRATGVSEDDARKKLQETMIGAKPAMSFAIGALAANMGLPGQVGRAVGGAATKDAGGIMQRFLKGTATGGGAGAVQSGAQAGMGQQADIQGGFAKGYDYDALIKNTLEGGVMTGPVGGLADVAAGRGAKAKRTSVVGVGNAPDVTQTAALDALKEPEAPKPAEQPNAPAAPAAEAATPKAGSPVEAQPAGAPPAEPAPSPAEAQPAEAQPVTSEVTSPYDHPTFSGAYNAGEAPWQKAGMKFSEWQKAGKPDSPPTGEVAAPTKQPDGKLIQPPKAFNQDVFTRSMTALGLPGDALKGLDGEKQARTALSHPEVAATLERPFTIDRSKQIPYIAGYSKDGSVMFRDARWPADLPDEHTLLHERVEKALIDTYGYGYRYSHKIATALERASYVAKHGSDAGWEDYQKRVLSLGKTMVHSHPDAIPGNLDETPYRDTADQGGMERLRGEPLPGEGAKELNAIIHDKPRVLDDLTKVDQAKEATRINTARAAKNSKDLLSEESGEVGAKHRTKAEVEKRTGDNAAAQEIFTKTQPEATLPTTAGGYQALKARLDGILAEANAKGIKIPTRVTDAAFDHVAYLREVSDIAKLLGKKSSFIGKGTKAEETRNRVTDFLTRERAAKGGDFSVMRSERKVAGETAMRKDQGDVETAAARAPRTLKDETTPVQSLVDEERAKASAPVKKIALTPEVKAHAEAALKLAEKRSTPVVTPKVTSIAAAAKKVERQPSEAQKEAGNYAMGHTEVHGIPVTIENPRGSLRSGVGPDGKPWSVKMPDHYGYIKRTEGADGDHVDAYIGPNPKSNHVFVIDQVAPDTRKFDEHKVMLGYANGAAAADAYERAFSDGRAAERVGDFRPMTIDQFKTWLKEGNTKKPAGEPKLAVNAMRAQTSEYEQKPFSHKDGLKEGEVATVYGPVTPVESHRAADYIRGLDVAAMAQSDWGGSVANTMMHFMQRRLTELMGDTPLHIVTPEDMRKASGVGDAWGLQTWDPDTNEPIVLINRDISNSVAAIHVALHEAMHVVTSKALHATNSEFRNTVATMMAETREYIDRKLNLPTELRKQIDYAFTNPDEFMSEALSHPFFQEILAKVPASDWLVKRLGLEQTKAASLWDALIGTVRKLIGLPAGSHKMVEAVIRATDKFAARSRQNDLVEQGKFERYKPNAIRAEATKITDEMKAQIERWSKSPEIKSKPWLLKLRDNSFIARTSDAIFDKGNNPVRKVTDTIQKISSAASTLLHKDSGIIEKIYQAEKKYAGPVWQNFTNLVMDETKFGVFADRSLAANTQLGKDALRGMQGKAQHARLAAMHAELPEDLKALRKEAMDYFTAKQNAINLSDIHNMLQVGAGINDRALATRIFDETATDADKARVGDLYDKIEAAEAYSNIKGPYFPMMRRGDYGIRGTLPVEAPTSPHFIRNLEGNVYEFNDRQAAIDFAAKQDTKASVRGVYVDKNTGERFGTDGTRILKEDVDAEQRFRVMVQNRHVDFFDKQHEAIRAAGELKDKGFTDVSAFERKSEMGSGDHEMMPAQMRSLAEHLQRVAVGKGMTEAMLAAMVQTAKEEALRYMGATRIQSRRLPRTFVEGYSKDIAQNVLDYSVSANRYLARMQHQPELDAAMKDMRDQADTHYGKDSMGRSAIAKVIEDRVRDGNGYNGSQSPITQRILTASFITRLASPAFVLVHATQPTMFTFPVLSARYGLGRTFGAMTKAYADIGAGKVMTRGMKATGTKVKSPNADVGSFFNDVLGRLESPNERAMLNYMADVNLIHANASLEVAGLIRSRRQGTAGAAADTGLHYLEGIARQIPIAMETVNRTVTALSAYRLARAAGEDHAAAVQRAADVVSQTHFNYAASNAPPVFNHPIAKLTFQFKRFGIAAYSLLGEQIGKAIRNENEGDRAEAIKTLALLAGTHMAFAGALGLPTEPIKALVTAASLTGAVNFNWNDVENAERTAAAGVLGPKLGEVFSRGLPRGIPGGFAFDVSNRLGLGDYLISSTPASNSPQDISKWVGDMVGGSPLSLLTDWTSGTTKLLNGDIGGAAEKLVPFRLMSSAIQAYRESTEGRVSAKSGKQTMAPYSPQEAFVRTMGLTPEREAETSAKQTAAFSASQSQQGKRTELLTRWAKSNPSQRGRMWGEVEAYNRANPGHKLTRAALDKHTQQQASPAHKHQQPDPYAGVFNTQ